MDKVRTIIIYVQTVAYMMVAAQTQTKPAGHDFLYSRKLYKIVRKATIKIIAAHYLKPFKFTIAHL